MMSWMVVMVSHNIIVRLWGCCVVVQIWGCKSLICSATLLHNLTISTTILTASNNQFQNYKSWIFTTNLMFHIISIVKPTTKNQKRLSKLVMIFLNIRENSEFVIFSSWKIWEKRNRSCQFSDRPIKHQTEIFQRFLGGYIFRVTCNTKIYSFHKKTPKT